ncbi:MAG: hypothetical protein U5R06_02670 [candidate division KSB1 bacterium]|nr:hypothetical protein [candidate division KSB1 bacterium]
MPALTVEKPLREKLGEDASESLLRLVNQSVEQRKHEMLEFLEEKFERRLSEEHGQINAAIKETEQRLDNRITVEISKVNERITTESSKVNERMTEEIGKVNERMTEEIGKVNVNIAHVERNMIRWMFIFWIGQIGAMLGLLFAFFK